MAQLGPGILKAAWSSTNTSSRVFPPIREAEHIAARRRHGRPTRTPYGHAVWPAVAEKALIRKPSSQRVRSSARRRRPPDDKETAPAPFSAEPSSKRAADGGECKSRVAED